MATLAVMKARIATELDRTDLSSQIASGISDAIAEYEQERFWFNESMDKTFTTVADQWIYTSSDASWIPDIVQIDAMFVTVAGNNRDMHKQSPESIAFLADNSAASGAPFEWAYFNKNIYVYPIPDDAYTVRVLGHVRLAALSGDSDTNAWTTEAERLIRRRAKALVLSEVIGSQNEAIVADTLAMQEFDRLKAESSRRRSMGQIRATEF